MGFEQFRGENAHNGRMSKSVASGRGHLLELMLIVVAAALAIVPARPSWIESWYSTALYPRLQRVLTPLSNQVPFAILDPLVIVVSVAALIVLVRIARAGWRREFSVAGRWLLHLATGAAAIYVLFLLLWGFNYRRIQMSNRLVLDRPAPTETEVLQLGLTASGELNRLYEVAHQQPDAVSEAADAPLRDAFAAVQAALSDAPQAVPGLLKHSLLGPYFRWSGVDGMVNPFGLEVIANPDLLPFERPFVAAHEWGHLAGYADESEANLIGWLTCVRALPRHQYSAWLYLYWQVSGEVTGNGRARLNGALEEGPRRDIAAVIARLRAGQIPALQQASWQVYDKYLKANRVESGVRSYSEVITLLLRARFGPEWTPVRRAAPAPASSAP